MRRSIAIATAMKRLNAIQWSGVPMTALGNGTARVDGVQIGKLDSDGLAAFNSYGNIPAHTHVSRVSVQVDRADPIIAGRKSRDCGASFEFRIHLGREIIALRNIRCYTLKGSASF